MDIHIETELINVENDSSIKLRIVSPYEDTITIYLDDKRYAIASWKENLEDFFAECIRHFNEIIQLKEDIKE